MRFLIVDANRDQCRMLAALIDAQDRSAFTANSCASAKWMWREHAPHYVIIDPALPDGDGLRVCAQMQERCPALVLAMSTNLTCADEIAYLKTADAYLRKPFLPEQLFAHIEALGRRARVVAEPQEPCTFAPVLTCGTLELDTIRHSASRDGRDILLSPIEYRLLKLLILNKDQVIPHDLILYHVWGPAYDNMYLMKAHISHLRKKLGNCIVTVPRVGYQFAPVEKASPEREHVR